MNDPTPPDPSHPAPEPTPTEPTPTEPTLTEIVIAGHRDDLATAARGLGSIDPQVRAAALGALGRLGALRTDHLREAFDDGSPVVRRRAAELAAGLPGIDLSVVLDDEDPTVAEVAAWSCGEHGMVADHVLERLIRLATTADDPIVRESAAAALGAIGDPRGLPAILTACRDKPAVRRRAVLALAPFLEDDDDDGDDGHDDDGDGGDDGDDDDDGGDDDGGGGGDDDDGDDGHDDQGADELDPGPGYSARAALEAALTDRDWQVRQAAEDLVRARRGGVW